MTHCEICLKIEHVLNSLKKGSSSNSNMSDKKEQYRVTKEGWYYCVAEGHDSIPEYFKKQSLHMLMRRPNKNNTEITVATFGIFHSEAMNSFNVFLPITNT